MSDSMVRVLHQARRIGRLGPWQELIAVDIVRRNRPARSLRCWFLGQSW